MIRYVAALALLGTAACSSESPDKADASPSAGMTFETAIKCQADLTAVARIYSVLGTQETGEKRDAMTAAASKRDAAAAYYGDLAKKLGTAAGRSEAEVTAAATAADAAIKVESDKRPFEEFAVWIGGESDKCAPPAQP